jgi:hypothetical protein
MKTSNVHGKHRTQIMLVIISFVLICSFAWAGNNNDGYLEDCSCIDGPYAIHLPKSLKALRSMGKLKSERIIEINKIMGTEDRELIYEGLRLIIITVKGDNTYTVATANITSPSWKNISGFRIGDTVESIKKRLKGKTYKIGDWLEVGGDTDILRFRISNGKVVEIEYQCYTG